MTKVIRIYGAPGTGKTSTIKDMIGDDLASGIYTESDIATISFSKASAKTLATITYLQPLPYNPRAKWRKTVKLQWHGTLHSVCYRLLKEHLGKNKLTIAEEYPDIHSVWNEQHPEARLIGQIDDLVAFEDTDFSRMQRERQRLHGNNREYRALREDWERLKAHYEVVDYTDLIELTLKYQLTIPVRKIYIDEAQDLTPLEYDLIKFWIDCGQYDEVIIVGDDDQAIYTWRGVEPETFLSIHADEEIVLPQSHRLPYLPWGIAQAVIYPVETRKKKWYIPREELGRLRTLEAQYDSQTVIDLTARLAKKGLRTMYIIPFAYTLEPVIQGLLQRGVLPYNPYSDRGGYQYGGEKLQILLTWLGKKGIYIHSNGSITIDMDDPYVRKTLQSMRKRVFRIDDWYAYTGDVRAETILTDEAIEAILDKNLDYFFANIKKNGTSKAQWRQIIETYTDKNGDVAEVIIGTIHSVKGGEADVVIIPNYISRKRIRTLFLHDDAWRRLWYVGVTRTRNTLILIDDPRQRRWFWRTQEQLLRHAPHDKFLDKMGYVNLSPLVRDWLID